MVWRDLVMMVESIQENPQQRLRRLRAERKEYHVPFYRQIQQYCHLGMKGLTESTLEGWFKKTVELLRPLHEELKREVFSCDYV